MLSGRTDHGTRDESLRQCGGEVDSGPGGFQGLGHGGGLRAVPGGLPLPQCAHHRLDRGDQLIEETARHGGHADIIRESLDGATLYPLMAAAEQWPDP